MKNRLLVVDDDTDIRELLEFDLSQSGYEVETAKDGGEGLQKALSNHYDLVLLDVMMPKMNGFDVCKNIKAQKQNMPVLLLTAKGTINDKTDGFNSGADDYIVKPFDPKELVARVKAVLRRYEPAQEEDKNVLKFEELEINLSNYSVSYHGKMLDFPPKEFELLSFLAQHSNRVFTREQLLDRIWGYEYVGDTRTVDVHIARLRKKMGNYGCLIVNKTGYGYTLKKPET